MSPLGIITALASAALAFAGWSMRPSFQQKSSGSVLWIILLAISPFIGVGGLLAQQKFSGACTLGMLLLPILVILHTTSASNSRVSKHFVVPLAFGSIFLFTSSALGLPSLGAFPAVISTLFVSVIQATLDIEEDIFENHGHSDNLEVEHHYRHRLAITAVVFFLFGTVSLWPWLGEMYGKTYFWILLFGVLLPLAFFWGRIRQPKIEGARIALIRFNRIAPILGLIHIAALIAA